MKLTDILVMLGILFGPTAAVQAQKLKDDYQEIKDRKINIFKTIMATRGEPLSSEQVRALNMIDAEFYGEINITDAWKDYLDFLCQEVEGDGKLIDWEKDRDNLFVDLLSKMSKSLGYNFDGDQANIKKMHPIKDLK